MKKLSILYLRRRKEVKISFKEISLKKIEEIKLNTL